MANTDKDTKMKHNREFWLGWFQRQINFLTDIGDGEEKATVFNVMGDVFNVVTYDDNVTELFVRNILDVLDAIIQRKTFEYQRESTQNYLTYHIVVNIGHLDSLLDWGTSIRGAFLSMPPEGYHLGDPCGHVAGEAEDITIATVDEYVEFINVARELVAVHDKNKGYTKEPANP